MILCVLILTLIPYDGVKSQASVNSPKFSNSLSGIRAARGYEARIYCQITNKGDSDLYWNCISKTVDVTIGPNENTNSALSRYVIDDSAADLGYYNLIIDKVKTTDNGTCSCIIIDKNQGTLRSETLLIVEDEAALPKTLDCVSEKLQSLVHSNTTFLQNEQVRLTCTSSGGVPLSHLQWQIVRPGSNEPETIHSYVSLHENSITATVNYTVTRFDNGGYIKCVQNHVLFPNAVECNPSNGELEPIVVLYAPVLRFEPENLRASDKSRLLTVTCKYEAEPSQLSSGPTIQFLPRTPGETLNFTYTTNGQKDAVNIYLSRSDVGKKLACVASNQIGESDIELVIQEDLTSSDVPVLVLSIVGAVLFVIVIAGIIVCCIFTCDRTDGASNSERGDTLSHRTDSNANIVEMTVEREHIQRSNGTLSRVESQINGRQYDRRINQHVSNGSTTLPTNVRRARRNQRPHSFHEGSMTTGRRREIPPSYSETELDSLPNARPSRHLSQQNRRGSHDLQRTRKSRRSSDDRGIPRRRSSDDRRIQQTSSGGTASASDTEQHSQAQRTRGSRQQRSASSGRRSRTSSVGDRDRRRVVPSSARSSMSEGLNADDRSGSVNAGFDVEL